VGSATGTVHDIGDVRMRVACVRSGRNVFLLVGLAATARYPEVDGQMAAAIRSFRAMPPAEADRILPQRIDLEVAKAGDTWDTIARRHGGVVMANLLATLNHAAVDRPPPEGVPLKVVVASEK
jgi:predicted Zn-dependent protease